jgi:hypothetical protein
MTEPFHVPEVIVPILARLDSVVTAVFTSVPEVGRVTLVRAVVVKVKPKAPAVVNAPAVVSAPAVEMFPPRVIVLEPLFTPVPPFVPTKVPASVMVPVVVTGPPDVVKPVVPPDTSMLVTVPPVPVADNVPATKDTPVPMVTLLKPPEPFPYRIDVPEVAGA